MTADRATEARRLLDELSADEGYRPQYSSESDAMRLFIESALADAEARGRAEGAREIERLNERLEELDTYMRRIRDEEE